jgi:hypothetical protein
MALAGLVVGAWAMAGGCNPNDDDDFVDTSSTSSSSSSGTAPTLTVNPGEATAEVGDAISATVVLTVPGDPSEGRLLVESDDEAVVPTPTMDDFDMLLPNMADISDQIEPDPNEPGTPSLFTIDSTGGADEASVAIRCASVGMATVEFSYRAAGASGYSASGQIDMTCTEAMPQASSHCAVALSNETLKLVDADGLLIDVTDWGNGPGRACTTSGSGASTVLACAGDDETASPALWQTTPFDPAQRAPGGWTKAGTMALGIGAFNGVAARPSGFVFSSVLLGLVRYDGSNFQQASAPPAAFAVACDQAGVCITTDSQAGGIYRSTDGLSWTGNNGTEVMSPLVHCDGTFVGYGVFNDQQLYSNDAGQTWNVGDLAAFGVNSFACGGGVWVASAQDETWRSTDGAQTWTQSSNAVGEVSYSPTASAFYAFGNDAAFTATLWRSDDGDAWTVSDSLPAAAAFETITCY